MKTDDKTDSKSGPQKPFLTPGTQGNLDIGGQGGPALKDTVRKYLDVAGITVDLNEIQEVIRKRPLLSPGVAAAAPAPVSS
jgi:hypothetical protein